MSYPAMIHISWVTYFEVVLVGCLIYWLAIGLLYFRRDIRAQFLRQPGQAPAGGPTLEEVPFVAEEPVTEEAFAITDHTAYIPPADQGVAEPEDFPLAYLVADEIRAVVTEAAKKNLIREELVQALRSKLQEEPYQELRGSAVRLALNQLIKEEVANRCEIALEESDLHMVWAK